MSLRDHDPQIPGKRISGSGDSGPFGTADADDEKPDLHGGYEGEILRLPRGNPGGVPGDGG